MAIHDTHLTQFTGTTGVITLPAINAGDSLTIYVTSDISGQTITAKDGVTSYSLLDNSSISAPDGQSIASFYKLVCTSLETITVTMSNGSSDTSVIVTTRSGRTAIPILQLTTPNTSSNSSPVTVTNTGITASAGDDIEVYPAIDNVAAAVWTLTSVPAGYTSGITTSTSTWAPPAMYYKDNVSAGATGNLASVMTASSNQAGWGGYVIRWPGSGAAAALAGPMLSSAVLTGDLTTHTPTIAAKAPKNGPGISPDYINMFSPRRFAAVPGGAKFSGAMQDIARASGTLTTNITTQGAMQDIARASGTLTTNITTQGAMRSVATEAGALTTSITTQGAMRSAASLAGALTTNISIDLQGAMWSTSTEKGALTTEVSLQSAMKALATMGGPLGAIGNFTGTQYSVATMGGQLSTGITISGPMFSTAREQGQLSASILLQSQMRAVATMTASFGANLTAPMFAVASMAGTLSTSVRLSSGMFARASSTALLTTGIAISSNQNCVAVMLGSIGSAPPTFTSAMTARALMNGLLSTGVTLAGVQRAIAQFAGALSVQSPATFGPSPGMLFIPLADDLPVIETLCKFTGETFVLGVDFSQRLPAGVMLSGQPVVTITETGINLPLVTPLIVFGNAVLDATNTIVVVPFTAGDPGMVYAVDIVCPTTDPLIAPAIRIRMPVI